MRRSSGEGKAYDNDKNGVKEEESAAVFSLFSLIDFPVISFDLFFCLFGFEFRTGIDGSSLFLTAPEDVKQVAQELTMSDVTLKERASKAADEYRVETSAASARRWRRRAFPRTTRSRSSSGGSVRTQSTSYLC